jgi:transposase
MNMTTVGVDLAKDILTVHAADAAGRVVELRDLRRKDCSAWLIELPKGCVVGMEACSGAHHWARVMHGFGLTPKIMAAEFVKPFRKSRSSKNDRNDAEALCTAVRQAQHALRDG